MERYWIVEEECYTALHTSCSRLTLQTSVDATQQSHSGSVQHMTGHNHGHAALFDALLLGHCTSDQLRCTTAMKHEYRASMFTA
jgi:hypothetical protein